MLNSKSGLMAAIMIAAIDAGINVAGPTLRTAGNGFRPTPRKLDTPQQREIAAWNDAVDARNAEKKRRKG